VQKYARALCSGQAIGGPTLLTNRDQLACLGHAGQQVSGLA